MQRVVKFLVAALFHKNGGREFHHWTYAAISLIFAATVHCFLPTFNKIICRYSLTKENWIILRVGQKCFQRYIANRQIGTLSPPRRSAVVFFYEPHCVDFAQLI